MKLRVLSRNDVRRAVSMAQAIEIVKGAFVQLSAGKAVVLVRTPLEVARQLVCVSASVYIAKLPDGVDPGDSTQEQAQDAYHGASKFTGNKQEKLAAALDKSKKIFDEISQ